MTNYQDDFAASRLPDTTLQPDFLFDAPEFKLPENLNCSYDLLDKHIVAGKGQAIALRTFEHTWTYQTLFKKANLIANVLIHELGLVPGNRVVIRSANNPMFVACWFGIIKAGGIVVATMPLLRAKELNTIVEKAEVSHILCDERLQDEVNALENNFVKQVITFDGLEKKESSLEKLMARQPDTFTNFLSKASDVAIIGFTSGTTGNPKMTAHYHRDLVLVCKAYPGTSLQPVPGDIFTGSPPIGFTFGLGGLVLFPLYYGASSFLIEAPGPENLLRAIAMHKITICFTAPTAWRILSSLIENYDISSLRKCVSAGEALPPKVFEDWFRATGLKILDGIGATELLHIFISSNDNNVKAGALGKPVHGYQAMIIDEQGKEVGDGEPGKLAVKGITGCRYLSDERQKEYVKAGWNITGDICKKDEEGYFWFVARNDDMIISSGYNIGAPEVESVLIMHKDIAECAVVGIPDEHRGAIVCAYIVLKDKSKSSPDFAKEIQDWFKKEAAPYKYPRKIIFMDSLPKNVSGKIARFALNKMQGQVQ